MPKNDFYDLGDYSPELVRQLVADAGALEQQGSNRNLQGKVLALLFLNPSLRTLTSMQATMTRMGGGTFVVSPEMSIHGLETRSGIVMDGTAAEHIREAVPVISSYADVIGIRAIAKKSNIDDDLADLEFRELQKLCDIPVLNLESSIRHPCQSLADWKTLDDLGVPGQGGKLVFSWVYHPDALPLAIPGDTIHMAAMRGMDVTILRPEGFELPAVLINRAERAGKYASAKITQTSDKAEALDGAQVLYAGSWSSTRCYGDLRGDKKLRDEHTDWCIEESWFENMWMEQGYFMHALPVRRGVEVDDRILDSPRSVVIRQAQNRMFTQMSVLKYLFSQ